MIRRHRHPLTLEELWQDGAPCKVRDLVAITAFSRQTIIAAAESGQLPYIRRGGRTPYLFQRVKARAWLVSIGFRVTAA